VAPVVEDLADRPKYWYKEVRLKSDVLARLNREHVQVRMPEPYAEHDENQVDLQVLTHPATTPEPEDREVGEDEEAPPAEAVHLDQYDPSYHSVREVNAHLAQIHDPEEKERVLEAERSGKARKGILES
jgi:hypothetical protein